MSTATDEEEDNVGPLRRWTRDAVRSPGSTYRGLFYVVTLFFVVTTLFPFYWLLVLALTPGDRMRNIGLLPNGFNPYAFVEMFERLPFHVYMFNSVVIALTTTLIVLLIGSFAGYAFGRLEFRGKTVLLLLLLAISYFPPAAFILPLFRLFTGNITLLTLPVVGAIQSPDWFNTPGAMVTPFSALFLPLTIFILTTFYSQIPDGLEDAARVEGTTRIGALFRVVIPLSAPGVATAGVLTFIGVYNEFFISFLMTDGQAENWAPIVWGVVNYQGQYQAFYNLMAAASIVGVLPVVILVVIAQERIVSGLTAGALKE